MNMLTKKANTFKLGALALLLSMFSTSAFAQSAEVIAAFDEYKPEAIAIGVAFAVFCWTIAAVAALRRKS